MTSSADIRLRAIEPEDLELLYAIENDAATWNYSSARGLYSRYTLRQYLASSQSDIYVDGQLRMVAEMVDGDGEATALGLVDLTGFDALALRAEVGIVLLPQMRCKGYGAAILRELSVLARHLCLHQLWATIAVTNSVAEHTFSQAQFQPVALLHHWLADESGFVDARIWQLML